MSAWTSSERFWVDVMNVGMGLLVMVPLVLVVGYAAREFLSRRHRRRGAAVE